MQNLENQNRVNEYDLAGEACMDPTRENTAMAVN